MGRPGWDMDLKGVRFNAIILRVHTDEGITGLGEPERLGRLPGHASAAPSPGAALCRAGPI